MIDMSFLPESLQTNKQLYDVLVSWSDTFYDILTQNAETIGKSVGVLGNTSFGLDLKSIMTMGEKAAFDDAYGRVMGDLLIEKMKKENGGN